MTSTSKLRHLLNILIICLLMSSLSTGYVAPTTLNGPIRQSTDINVTATSPDCGELRLSNPSNEYVTVTYSGPGGGGSTHLIEPGQTDTLSNLLTGHVALDPGVYELQARIGRIGNQGEYVSVNGQRTARVTVNSCSDEQSSDAQSDITTTSNPTESSSSSDAAPQIDVTVNHHTDKIEFDIQFTLPDTTETMTVDIRTYVGTVTERKGFTSDLEWTGETPQPSFTYEVSTDKELYPSNGGKQFAATDDWAFIPTSGITVLWLGQQQSDSYHLIQDASTESNIQVSEPVVATDQFLYIGPSKTYTRTVDGQQLRVVVPDAATVTATEAEQAFDSVADAVNYFSGFNRDPMVTFFIGPDPIQGAFTVDKVIMIGGWPDQSPTASVGRPGDTWIHEYVHTVQPPWNPDQPHLSDKMFWFIEASASYYAVWLPLKADGQSLGTVGEYVDAGEYTDAVLSDNSTQGDPYVPYLKGPVVLYGLDQKIREATDGQKTLRDVFQQMNQYDGTITVDVFKDIVADVAGVSMDDWIDTYVTTSASPSTATDIETDIFNSEETASHVLRVRHGLCPCN